MNRTGLVLIGAGVAVLGYALLWSGLSTLNPCIAPDGLPHSTMEGLVPGAVPLRLGPTPKVKEAA